MSRIIVYGDSYASSSSFELGWTSLLSSKMQLEEVNRAVSGSSSEYAIEQFVNDVNSNFIRDNDIIIFVLSTPGRLNLSYQQQEPGTASQFLHEVSKDNLSYNWYMRNKKYIQWYIVNKNVNESSINHEAYVHMVRNFAESNPSIKVLFLANSNHYVNVPYTQSVINFLRPKLYLTDISEREIKNFTSYFDWTSHIPGIDFRVNHLSKKNHKILVDLVIESLETLSIENFTQDKFISNIFDHIQSKEDYLKYYREGHYQKLGTFVNYFKITNEN